MPSMATTDMLETFELGLARTRSNRGRARLRSRLLSANGPCHRSWDPKQPLKCRQMEHTRGVSYHSRNRGMLGRCHRPPKSRVRLRCYCYYPLDPEQESTHFVGYCNRGIGKGVLAGDAISCLKHTLILDLSLVTRGDLRA